MARFVAYVFEIVDSAECLLNRRNVKRFRGWLVFEARRLLYHSILGSRVIKKKKKHPQKASLKLYLPPSCTGFRGVRVFELLFYTGVCSLYIYIYMCKAHDLMYHSTLGSRVTTKKKKICFMSSLVLVRQR